mmetsp:Transcript_10637/g.25793  ORF Transcript_10637/g.25793 Transcript_10637/m.25793 type:complete len:205 (+) Transcript_10637:115-729(+)
MGPRSPGSSPASIQCVDSRCGRASAFARRRRNLKANTSKSSSTMSRFILPRPRRCAASSCTCSGSSISSRVLCASGHVATKAVPVNAMLDFLMCGIVWSKRRLITSMILSIWTSGLVVHGGAIHLVRWQKGGCIVKANMSELNQEGSSRFMHLLRTRGRSAQHAEACATLKVAHPILREEDRPCTRRFCTRKYKYRVRPLWSSE